MKDFTYRGWQSFADRIPALAITDCRSLYDVAGTDLPRVSDRRLALECTILKEIKNLTFKWVPSQQMFADALTKETHGEVIEYSLAVRKSMLWCCGPDNRAPPGRKQHKDYPELVGSSSENPKTQ